MSARSSLALALLLGALACAGCEPKCREVRPLSEVEAEILENVDDDLDDIGATKEQRAKIHAIVKGLMPKLRAMREQNLPRQREVVAELKRDAPDRTRLGELIAQNIESTTAYLHAVVDASLEGHRVLQPEQRRKLAKRYGKPSEAFDGSWMLDRAVDYFLSRIDATKSQRELVYRIKQDMLRRGRALQRRGDALRAEAAREFSKDEPNRALLHGSIEKGRELTATALFDLAGYYVLFSSKLDARQRQLVHAELVRFEPCKAPAEGARADAAPASLAARGVVRN